MGYTNTSVVSFLGAMTTTLDVLPLVIQYQSFSVKFVDFAGNIWSAFAETPSI